MATRKVFSLHRLVQLFYNIRCSIPSLELGVNLSGHVKLGIGYVEIVFIHSFNIYELRVEVTWVTQYPIVFSIVLLASFTLDQPI